MLFFWLWSLCGEINLFREAPVLSLCPRCGRAVFDFFFPFFCFCMPFPSVLQFPPSFHPGCAPHVRDPYTPLPTPVWISCEYLCRLIWCLEKSVCPCQSKIKNKGCGLEDMSPLILCHAPLLHTFACLSGIPEWICIPLHIFPPSLPHPSFLPLSLSCFRLFSPLSLLFVWLRRPDFLLSFASFVFSVRTPGSG